MDETAPLRGRHVRGRGIVQRVFVSAVRRLHVRPLPAQGLDAVAFHCQGTALRAAPALAGNRAHPDHAVDDRADRCGALRFLPLSIAVLVALGIFVSFGTGGTFALVPLLFPDRPGIAAGFIGGISTVGGIACPLIFASVNAHVGYLYVALYMFAPFILFYFWAARYERYPQEHGLLGRALAGQRA